MGFEGALENCDARVFFKGQSLNPRTSPKIRYHEWKLNYHPKKVLSRRTPDEISFDKVLRLV